MVLESYLSPKHWYKMLDLYPTLMPKGPLHSSFKDSEANRQWIRCPVLTTLTSPPFNTPQASCSNLMEADLLSFLIILTSSKHFFSFVSQKHKNRNQDTFHANSVSLYLFKIMAEYASWKDYVDVKINK